jgi:hypothetical protein
MPHEARLILFFRALDEAEQTAVMVLAEQLAGYGPLVEPVPAPSPQPAESMH